MSELQRYDYKIEYNGTACEDQLTLVESDEGTLYKASDVDKLLASQISNNTKETDLRCAAMESKLREVADLVNGDGSYAIEWLINNQESIEELFE